MKKAHAGPGHESKWEMSIQDPDSSYENDKGIIWNSHHRGWSNRAPSTVLRTNLGWDRQLFFRPLYGQLDDFAV